ncbi:MAG TPA: hypothetical protein DC050_10665 [Pseudomonas sp.]|nr:hypothetical protein [Pseudomonas sp.]
MLAWRMARWVARRMAFCSSLSAARSSAPGRPALTYAWARRQTPDATQGGATSFVAGDAERLPLRSTSLGNRNRRPNATRPPTSTEPRRNKLRRVETATLPALHHISNPLDRHCVSGTPHPSPRPPILPC